MQQPEIKYCLYSRKSSESDERQTMLIDSQINEMTALAERDGLDVVEIKRESHSAKQSGARPLFMELLSDIREGKYNAILTWAADRLSRNAGDLGSLVDLMDQGKLLKIQTYSQSFSNSPDEKFLLMILCSQAKLENDNRGVNVKRGLKAKCEISFRPGYAPLGYLNVIKYDRIREIVVDRERAPIIVQMFERVANENYSGRMLKRWLDRIGFTTRSGKQLALSKVFATLKNSFYYGEFEFGGVLYKGRHTPLISHDLYMEVQRQLITSPKSWKKHKYGFRGICTCGRCGAQVIPEEKLKHLKYGGDAIYTYYHCTRTVDYDCDEPYITERDLIEQLLHLLPQIKLDTEKITQQLKMEIDRFHRLRSDVLNQEYLSGNLDQLELSAVKPSDNEMLKTYFEHILKTGNNTDRQNIVRYIKTKLVLKNKQLLAML